MDGDWICNFLSPCQELPLGCAWPKFFFFSSCHLCLIRPSHLPSILSRKLPSKLISTFTNKYNGNMRGEKNLGLWWIRAVRCFQVSFVFVLLPVRFFVFPATGNNAPAHTVPMVHGYLHRIWPPPDVITVLSLLSITVGKQPLLTDCPSPSHQDTTDPMETLHVPHCWWLGSYNPVKVCQFASDLLHPPPPVIPCLIQLMDRFQLFLFWQISLGYWHVTMTPCFVSLPCHLDSTVVLPLCLIAMSPDPQISVISHCHGILIHCYTNNPLKYHLPAHCQLFLIPFSVDSVIHCSLNWDPHGFRLPLTPILFTSMKTYNSHLHDCRQTQCKTHLKWTHLRCRVAGI